MLLDWLCRWLAWGSTNDGCKFKGEGFAGDSIDREAVREILIERFGYKWPEGV